METEVYQEKTINLCVHVTDGLNRALVTSRYSPHRPILVIINDVKTLVNERKTARTPTRTRIYGVTLYCHRLTIRLIFSSVRQKSKFWIQNENNVNFEKKKI